MPFKVSLPETKTFNLDKSDISGETIVGIRAATTREHSLRSELWSTHSRIYRSGGTEQEVKVRISVAEQMRREVFLTLAACNILDEQSNPLFGFYDLNGVARVNMTEEVFEEVWGKLPLDVAVEIHGKVLQVNPMWASE